MRRHTAALESRVSELHSTAVVRLEGLAVPAMDGGAALSPRRDHHWRCRRPTVVRAELDATGEGRAALKEHPITRPERRAVARGESPPSLFDRSPTPL